MNMFYLMNYIETKYLFNFYDLNRLAFHVQKKAMLLLVTKLYYLALTTVTSSRCKTVTVTNTLSMHVDRPFVEK